MTKMKVTYSTKSLLIFLTLISICLCACESKEERAAKEQAKKDIECSSEVLKKLNKIKAATEVGVNFQQYMELVIDAKASVNESTSKISNQEIKQPILKAMDCYADALDVWNEDLNKGYFKSSTEKAKGYIQKYSISLSEKDSYLADKLLFMRPMWNSAESSIKEAEKAQAEPQTKKTR